MDKIPSLNSLYPVFIPHAEIQGLTQLQFRAKLVPLYRSTGFRWQFNVVFRMLLNRYGGKVIVLFDRCAGDMC